MPTIIKGIPIVWGDSFPEMKLPDGFTWLRRPDRFALALDDKGNQFIVQRDGEKVSKLVPFHTPNKSQWRRAAGRMRIDRPVGHFHSAIHV